DSVGQEEGSIAWTLLHILYNFLMTTQDNSRSRYHLPELYRSFLKSNVARKLLEDQNCKMTRSVLCTIRKLQGLVNHPFLVRSKNQQLEAGFDDDETRAMFADIDRLDSRQKPENRPVHEELSGKLALVCQLLGAIKASGSGDRIVIISNWTQTLDLIEKLCAQHKWPTHRLDGTMAINKRMCLGRGVLFRAFCCFSGLIGL
ncbi:okr, partial [Symbiodinium microadriaticum]